MKRTINSLITCILMVAACTTPVEDETPVTPETPMVHILCVMEDATSISASSAILNGSATIQDATASQAQACFYYSSEEADAATLQASGSKITAGEIAGTGGEFSSTLEELSPLSTYYYVASVSIDGQEVMGSVKSFTTESDALVVTGAVTDITEHKATVHGIANLTPDMVDGADYGIEYSATDIETKETTVWASERDENGRFVINLTKLDYNTKYYYRSVVRYRGVREYGELSTFTTNDFSIDISTEDVTDLSVRTVTLRGKMHINSIDEMSGTACFLYSTIVSDLEELKTKGMQVDAATVAEDGSFSVELPYTSVNTQYYYVASSTVEGKTEYGELVSFSTLPYAEPEAVDLGLSVKWASFNLGATKPEEYGGHYQWAGTEDVSDMSIQIFWDNCPYHTGTNRDIEWTKYVAESSYGPVDNLTTLEACDDAATVNLGGTWRMPTISEWVELRDSENSTWTWTTIDGINGYRVRSKHNSNSIFLPAAGIRSEDRLGDFNEFADYWSSTHLPEITFYAYKLDFHSEAVHKYYCNRFYGLSVRPVTK